MQKDFTDLNKIVKEVKKHSSKRNKVGMARFGINTETALGASLTDVRKIAKKIGKNHSLALKLWDTNIHEIRLLASIIAEPEKLTEKQFDKFVNNFNSWDICDVTCGGLLNKTKFVDDKIFEYVKNKKEFVKRTSFVLMACLAVHDKERKDKDFKKFYPLIINNAYDERNFVKKAVNWALRQIGKRNKNLNKECIKVGEKILKQDTKSSRWIARDALRELRSEAVQKRLK